MKHFVILSCVMLTTNDASIANSASARMMKELDYAKTPRFNV